MKPLHELTATEIVNQLKFKKHSAENIYKQLTQRNQELEPHIKAWVVWDPKKVEQHARAIDQLNNDGKLKGALGGIPIGIKDIYNTAEYPTEMGSQIWKGFTPGNDARVIFNLRYDGAVVFGKTTTSEFAVHEPTVTRNPHNLECGPGTSSAGSAAAVAAGMVPIAMGSQTGGSVIRPASYCGIHGFKPTFGLVPRTGVLKTTDTLDTIGWFARSIDDIELIFDSVRVSGLNYPIVNEKVQRRKFKFPMTVGIYRGPHWKHAAPETQNDFDKALKELANSGKFELREFKFPEFNEVFEAHERIYCKALSYYFRAEERNTRDHISPVLLDMLDRGENISPEQYHKDIQRQAELTQEFSEELPFDFFVTLSAGGEVPIGLDAPDRLDSCKVWTYLGLPTLNLPVFKGSNGRPVGLQILSKKYADYDVMDGARAIASVLGHASIAPVTPEISNSRVHA